MTSAGERVHYLARKLVLLGRILEYLSRVVVEDLAAQRHQVVLGHVFDISEQEYRQRRLSVPGFLCIKLLQSLDEVRVAGRLHLQDRSLWIFPAKYCLNFILVEQQLD